MIDTRDLLLTGKDPWDEPRGGQAAFARHLLTAYGSVLAVSSYCNDESVPIGSWVKRPYGNQTFWFFSRGPDCVLRDRKPLVPERVTSYLKTRRHMQAIQTGRPWNLLTDSPELLIAAAPEKWESVCYRFAGVNNPVSYSRYIWARLLGGLYERYLIYILNKIKPDVLLASADEAAIEEFFTRIGNALDRSRFYHFPTRIDTDLFRPIDTAESRLSLGIQTHSKVFVATGRLCWIKGWNLLLEAFAYLKSWVTHTQLIFVGDGEDHHKLEMRAEELKVRRDIRITGFVPQAEVVRYMNAADVCLVGSHREGWSLAMCEMIACGKAVVSTDVSGAREMVRQGENGFVVESRDPRTYAEAVRKAMSLESATDTSLRLSSRYSVRTLAVDLDAIWLR